MTGKSAIAVLVLVAAARAGDEPARVDVGTPDRWTAGEVVTASVMESTRTRVSGAGSDADEPRQAEIATRLDAKFVQRCIEADAQGRAVHSLIRVDAWSMKGATRDDRCLEGALVEVTPAGWTLLASRANPSRLARGWLNTRFGEDPRGFSGGFAELGSGGAHAAGESWVADPPVIAKALVDGGLPVAVEQRKWRFRLAEADASSPDPKAKVVFDETFPVSGEGRAGGRVVEVAEGSTARARGSYSGTPGNWHRDGHMQTVSETSLDTSSGGLSVRLAITAEESEDWSAGGAPPELPAEPAAATACGIGAGERWAVGDTMLERGDERGTAVATPVGADGKDGAPECTANRVEWEAETECVEASDGGMPRVLTLVLRRWKRTHDAESDESLAGAVLRVTRDGWKITMGGDAASASAKEWLESRYGRGVARDDALRAAITPVMRVAAGQSWASDPDETTAALQQRSSFPFESGSVHGTGTVTGLRGDGPDAAAAVGYEVEGTIACAPGCNGAGAAVLNGSVRVKGVAEGPAGRWTRLGSFHDTTEQTVTVPGEPIRRVALTEERRVVRSPLAAEGRSAASWDVSADAKIGRRDFAGAIDDCTKAIGADAKYTEAWFDRARAKAGSGDDEGAIADYTKAIEIDPELAGAWNNRGLLRRARGDLDGAISDYTKAVEASPRFAAAWRNRGRAKADKGDLAGAIADYDKAVEIRPKYADAYSDRAMAHYNRREYELAVADHTKAAELEPKTARHLVNRGNAKSAQGDLAGSLADHDAAIAVDPKYAIAYYFRADVKSRRGDARSALDDYAKAIELDPKFASNWNDRGCVRESTGDLDGALADFTKAMELDPRDSHPPFNRARVRQRKGDVEGAIADCGKALEIDPKYAAAYNRRANYRDDSGDPDGAVADWTKAIEADPEYGGAHMSIARSRFLPGLPTAPVVEGIRRAIALEKDQDYERLWLWLARARAGEQDAATKELKDYAAARKPAAADDWYPVLVGLLGGTTSEDAAFAAAKTSDPKTSGERLCEAAFYAGMLRAIRGDVEQAVALLDRCIATDVRNFTEFGEARRWRRALLLGGATRPGAAPGAAGRVVVGADPRGPLARAGLREGDRIVGVDGVPAGPRDLDTLLSSARPGTHVNVEFVRGAETTRAEVVLGAWGAK
jgi:tetratricopeptide (TPR) repeat protein